ncbi:MAG: autotransporter assembly complex protein TamA [Steroidobacteraceae bacterium]
MRRLARRGYATFELLFALMAFCSFAHAADPQEYRVDFGSVGNGEMDATLKSTSDLLSLRSSAPVSPFGLIARARNDIDRLTTVLESFGYYECRIVIKINGMLLTDPGLGDALGALPKGGDAQVAISFTLGTLYALRRIDIEGELPESMNARAILGLKPGQAAVASSVLAAGARLQLALQEAGFAFATVPPPVATQAADAPVLDLTFQVEAGQKVNIGEIHFEGLQRVHESLARGRLLLRTGDQYRPSAIERARHDLLGLNVFAQVSVQIGKQVDASGGVPITFEVRERKRHAVNFSSAYSSDLGGSGGVGWTDRNVFGNGEQLRFAASVIDLGGSDSTGTGYDTNVKYLIPEFGHRDQSLQLSVGALKQSLQAYDQTSKSTGATLSRRLSSIWTVSVGLSFSDEHIIQDQQIHDYTLIALPLSVGYDTTNLASPLEDPVHGIRGSVSVTPTLAIGNPNAIFTITQVKIATFFDLSDFFSEAAGRSVLAARALAGLAQGAGEYSLPPDQRFYAGGSATIRGYQYQSVGPLFPAGTPAAGSPIGGTAITAGGLEMRQRFGYNFGAAAFVDGGQVSASLKAVPDEFRIGVGAGLRYYTPIGPIRLDIAAPTRLQPWPNNDHFEIYIGLGQAF